MVRLLVDNGADVNIRSFSGGRSPLSLATLKGQVDIVGVLLDEGANIEAGDKFGATPLMTATEIGSLKLVEMLLDRGANVHGHDWTDSTALFLAAERGFDVIAELLISRGSTQMLLTELGALL
jgi:ankyrin repeat protein